MNGLRRRGETTDMSSDQETKNVAPLGNDIAIISRTEPGPFRKMSRKAEKAESPMQKTTTILMTSHFQYRDWMALWRLLVVKKTSPFRVRIPMSVGVSIPSSAMIAVGTKLVRIDERTRLLLR